MGRKKEIRHNKKASFESNWLHKSLENLEKDIWPAPDPDDDSYLVNTCHRLRNKQLKDFDIEDLRIMIGQSIGLRYLIPIALEKLNNDILAEGDFYEGDLLTAVLQSDANYWRTHPDNWKRACDIFKRNSDTLKAFDTTVEIRKKWFKLFTDFEKIKTVHNNA